MSKIRFVVLGLVLVLVCGSSLVIASQKESDAGDNLCIPVGTIELTAPEGVESKKSQVEFPHSKHFSYNCRECHHAWDLSADLVGCQTSGCHDRVKAPKKPDTTSAFTYYKKAYHQKCIGCHKAIKAKNNQMEKKSRLDSKDLVLLKTGPTGCKACHPKD